MPILTGHDAFGRFQPTAELGDGRFGPTFVGIDTVTNHLVVIRTFREPRAEASQRALLEALRRLCETSLDHASIGQPIACGIEAGVPYLAHTYLPGEPVDEFLEAHGPQPLADVVVRVTHLAAAIDFAAAAGAYHGAIGPRDIIFAPDHTGVSGFGLVQALRAAGVEANEPTAADDIFALAAMTFEQLTGQRFTGGSVREGLARMPSPESVHIDVLVGALDMALSTDPATWPDTALQFAASLQEAQVVALPADAAPVRPGPREPLPVGRLAPGLGEFGFEPAPLRAGPSIMGDEPVRIEQPALMFDAPLREPTAAFLRGPDPELWDPEVGAEPTVMLRPPVAVRDSAVPRVMLLPVREHSRAGWRVAAVAAFAGLVVLGTLGTALFLSAPDDNQRTMAAREGAGDEGGAVSREDIPASEPVESPAAESAPGSGGAIPGVPPSIAPPALAPEPVMPPREPGVAPASPPSPPGVATGALPAPRSPVLDPQSPVPDQSGRVLVRSNPPGARVLVDGQPRGDTPVAIRGLEYGAHTIAVTAPGYPAWERRVMLTGDRPAQSFDIALADGSAGAREPAGPAANVPSVVHVDSRPSGAQVWVDGALAGTTPLVVSGVGAGSHAVRIELAGYRPWTTSVLVGQGARARVAASLER